MGDRRSEDEYQEMIEEFDGDGDDHLDYNEFK
jgi:Ca2+-binding EF-hand superfamily protein